MNTIPNIEMQSRVELVTPELAEEWLKGGAPNRTISLKAVDRIAADILSGRWMMNGQSIVFNAEGQLIDGRHRLSAVLLARTTVPMLVVRGIPQAAFTTMDSGRSRTVGDVMSIQGHKNTNVLSAAAKLIWCYCAGVNLRYQPPRAMLLDLVNDHPKLDAAIASVANKKSVGSVIPITQAAAVLALANESGRWDTEVVEFLEGSASGEGLFRGDGRLTMRNWFIRARQDNRNGARQYYAGDTGFAVIARCWTAFARKEKLHEIRVPGSINCATVTIEGFERRLWKVPAMLAAAEAPQEAAE